MATKLKKPRRAVRSKPRKPAQRRSRRAVVSKAPRVQTTSIPVARVAQLLTEYQNALSNYDAQASVALWGSPGMMLNDELAGVLDDKQKMAEAIAVSYPFYKQLGLDRVEHTIKEVVQLSERVVRVFLTWHFYSGDELMVDGDYHYVMRDEPEGLRMFVAISIDEVAKLKQLAKEKGVPFPEGQ